MKSEIRNRRFWFLLLRVIIAAGLVLGVIVGINYFVDASHVITSRSHEQMAVIALQGYSVAVPENYNERSFQMAIVDHLSAQPETLVLGSSRGMYLGTDTTGIENIYNHCISGSTIEDYYAVLQLHLQKFSKAPSRIILEISPWILFEGNPEVRWTNIYSWRIAAEKLWNTLNAEKLEINRQDSSPFYDDGNPYYSSENPWFSLPYFQYNCEIIRRKGLAAFSGDPAHASTDPSEPADLPDGSIRKAASEENASAERLAKVQAFTGAVTYEKVQNMTEIGPTRGQAFEHLVQDLLDRGTEVIFFLQPFSPTQCRYSFDENLNPAFSLVETYLRNYASARSIKVVGSYDSRNYGITDENFQDYSHLDKQGVKIIWNADS